MREILLSHGGGGEETWQLIKGLFFRYFSNPILNAMEDSAVFGVNSKIAFTTDSFTVKPVFFKGGNIGKLAVAGTVNDLAVMGAKPLYLSAAFIIEEGFLYSELEEIVKSMAEEARTAGVSIVTGDTKVVPKGSMDGVFINTSGVGELRYEGLSASNLRDKDVIIISGTTGDHGACIVSMRDGLELEVGVESDCRSMWDLVNEVLLTGAEVHAIRDPTRGGLSAVMNEWAAQSAVCIEIDENTVPVKDPVRGLCEIMGLEPFHLACEGRVVLAVSEKDKYRVLDIINGHSAGKDAAIIGRVSRANPGKAVLKTPWGTRKLMEPPAGELIPRIC